MTVRELIYESGIDIQTECKVKHYDDQTEELIELEEDNALNMEIMCIYNDGEFIILEV